jgi:hypothetical protein
LLMLFFDRMIRDTGINVAAVDANAHDLNPRG